MGIELLFWPISVAIKGFQIILIATLALYLTFGGLTASWQWMQEGGQN